MSKKELTAHVQLIKFNRMSSRDLVRYSGTQQKNHKELCIIGDILARRFPCDMDFELFLSEQGLN